MTVTYIYTDCMSGSHYVVSFPHSNLLITDTCLYVLRDVPGQKALCTVMSRHPLKNIVKITSKKKMPELITFKFGTNDAEEGMIVTETQRFLIDKAGK